MSLHTRDDPWQQLHTNLLNATISSLPNAQDLFHLPLLPLLRYGCQIRESLACKQVTLDSWRLNASDNTEQKKLYERLKNYANFVYTDVRDTRLASYSITELLQLYVAYKKADSIEAFIVDQLENNIHQRMLAMESDMRLLQPRDLQHAITEAQEWLDFAKNDKEKDAAIFFARSNFLARLRLKLAVWQAI